MYRNQGVDFFKFGDLEINLQNIAIYQHNP